MDLFKYIKLTIRISDRVLELTVIINNIRSSVKLVSKREIKKTYTIFVFVGNVALMLPFTVKKFVEGNIKTTF